MRVMLFIRRLFLYPYKRFKAGSHLMLYLTMRCNLNCDYCGNRIYTGKMPVFKQEMNFDDWMEYIKTFPTKVKRVDIVGGEPTLLQWLPEIINYLIKKRVYVYLYTNLSVYYKIHSSCFLRFVVTYHSKQNRELFDTNLALYRSDGHTISVCAINESNEFEEKPYCDLKLCMTPDSLRIAPDGTILTNHFDLMEYLSLCYWKKKRFNKNLNLDFKCTGYKWEYTL